ncbi:helicase-related protein [Metabacillus fastidiosus]|uniref:DEAD/DEAH box helicase n=1 Tax=Metabacillus fastidiosus TaxID=1458 RepID=UPI003D27B4D2
MEKLKELHAQAIEKTKQTVHEEIEKFLEEQEDMPSYEEFIEQRKQYIAQIWVNVWSNLATSRFKRKEKISYLLEKGYEFDVKNKNIINKLFRDEIRLYEPFVVLDWLNRESFDDWEARYEAARSRFQQKQKEMKEAFEKEKNEELIKHTAQSLLIDRKERIYLHIRYYIAGKLAYDFHHKSRYELVEAMYEDELQEQGVFHADHYPAVADFLSELTGESTKIELWDGNYFEYETYGDRYERLVHHYVHEEIPERILEEIPSDFSDQYEMLHSEELTVESIDQLIYYHLEQIKMDCIDLIEEEDINDLLRLSEIEFDPAVHKSLYEKDKEERERRKAEQLAEIKRKEEEEKRMLDDIFGREYGPSSGGNVEYVLHVGDTNTGKTYQALKTMMEAPSGLYLAPLRLLALEVYDKLNKEGVPCNLKTGEEEKVVSGASHISCTVEMFYEKESYDVVVIDEAQLIADKDRGFSWYKAITKAKAKEVHIIGSNSMREMILELLGDANITIYEYTRNTPLEVEKTPFRFKYVQKGDALICFSRRKVLETAARIQNDGHSVSMIYGSMPPETRKKQMNRFIEGETKVIVATDAIGLGLNLPIRRIIFLDNEKFDGTRRRRLTSQEVKQIAGRAGRKGIYDIGKVAFMSDVKKMAALLHDEDRPIATFAIAPTTSVFERFQKYHHDLGTFFELWKKFESPFGTKKASLQEERELYDIIRHTEVEARLSLDDLYGFLHLPFSAKEPTLIKQWRDTMFAIVNKEELPEPEIRTRNLEELELTYKAIGLQLLFLYRLGRGTEAIYWEREREKISDEVHERLKTEVKKMTKKCKRCGRKLPLEFKFAICDSCHAARYMMYDDFDNI